MSVWKTQSHTEKKPWGHEVCFTSPFGISGKKISIKKNCKTSLKYYKSKDEVLFCLSGKIRVFAPQEKEFGDIKTTKGNFFNLIPGEIILIQRNNPYRFIALEDSELIECGLEPRSSCVMLEDEYGRISVQTPNILE